METLPAFAKVHARPASPKTAMFGAVMVTPLRMVSGLSALWLNLTGPLLTLMVFGGEAKG